MSGFTAMLDNDLQWSVIFHVVRRFSQNKGFTAPENVHFCYIYISISRYTSIIEYTYIWFWELSNREMWDANLL